MTILVALAALALAALRPDGPAQSALLEHGRFATDANGAAINGQQLIAPTPTRPLRIAILPDRTTGRAWGLPYLERAVSDLNRIEPDAVFCVGDLVQGYTRSPETYDDEAAEFLRIVRGLHAEFFPTAGNHDVISGTRDPKDRQFAERYRRVFGPLWYSVDLDRATVLVLFSDDGSSDREIRLGEEQLAWLKEALARAAERGKPIILLMHRPLWRYESAHWDTRVQPLLEEFGADCVIAGHFHSMQRDHDVGGVAYHIIGTCGGMIDQHPYAGQLQHLTFVDVDDAGAVRVYHQPVGATLPEDFVLRSDQDRAFALRGERDVLTWRNAVAEPCGTGDASVSLGVRNPIDVPIDVSARLVTEPPQPSPVGDEIFVTRTPIDAFNPFVVSLPTRFAADAVAPIRLGPGETREIVVPLRWSDVEAPPPPPELRLTATFTDSKDRVVPVWLRATVPFERIVRYGSGAPAYPIAVWSPSPFDTLEPNPTMRAEVDASGDLVLEVALTDDVAAHDEIPAAAGRKAIDDPAFDAIVVRIWPATEGGSPTASATPRELLVESFPQPGASSSESAHAGEFVDGAFRPCPEVGLTRAFEVVEEGRRGSIRLRLPATWGPWEGRQLNVGVADNDRTYHTQWRWLAPAAWPATLRAAGS